MYGEGAVTDETCQKWFAKFRVGDFSLDNAPQLGRPVEVDSDQIETLIEINIIPCRKQPTYSKYPNQALKIICTSLVMFIALMFGFHLSEKNLFDHICACNCLLKRHKNVLFLKQIVMGDEKWILYNNVKQKRSWGKRNEPTPTTPKAGLHPKKVMLCIWLEWKGVLYDELLLENQTINSNKYCSQLDQVKAALNEKHLELVNRKHIIFHQDNARPNVSLMTRQKLLQLGWEVLIHLPYSLGIASLDFHLFRSLQNSLNGKNFNSLEDCKWHLDQFFAQKDNTSWEL